MKIPNVEKAIEGRSDGSTAKELMKLAEKDPMTNIELELIDTVMCVICDSVWKY